MTYNDIIAEVRGIINETNPANSHVTNAELLNWANECTLYIISQTNSYPKVQFSANAASSLTLDEGLLTLDYVSITDPSGTHRKVIPIDFVSFSRYFPDWENAPAAIPTHLVRMTVTNWSLQPAPNSDYLGAAMTLVGKTRPTPDTDFTKEPPVSIVFHSAFAPYIAWHCFLKMNQADKATAQFSTFKTLFTLNMRTGTSTQGGALRFTGAANI